MQTPFSTTPRRPKDPLHVVRQLSADIGPRAATSTGEAQAAAFFNAQLRLAGMQVATPPFMTVRLAGVDDLLLALLALLTVLLYRWQPLVALGVLLLLLVVTIVRRWLGRPLLALRGTSQHVVGVLTPAQRTPPRRVVLLAALDAPPKLGPLRRLLAERVRSALALALLALIAAFMLLTLVAPGLGLQRGGWYLQWLAALALLPNAVVVLLTWLRPASPGASCHAAALATIAAAVAATSADEQREVWAVAVGASYSGGLDDLLRRYPFGAETLLVTVEGLGIGELAMPMQLRGATVNPLLLEHAAAVTPTDLSHQPCAEQTLAATLIRRGYRVLSVTSIDPRGRWPHLARADDTVAAVDAGLLIRAQGLLTELLDAAI